MVLIGWFTDLKRHHRGLKDVLTGYTSFGNSEVDFVVTVEGLHRSGGGFRVRTGSGPGSADGEAANRKEGHALPGCPLITVTQT